MDSIEDEYFSLLAKDLLNGRNAYLRMSMKGSSVFNPAWINKIEDCLFELGQIINNPREVTTSQGSITPIELAKKINGESVVHLASHTQYIKEVNEFGDVVPAKILSHSTVDDIHTYENRFIATFIRRLVLFVEKRYEFIKSVVNLETKNIMYIKNKSIVDGKEVEIETKISVKKETEDDITVTAKDYIARIEAMREYITFYYNSKFMKEIRNEKDVRSPIIQTNIIRKNPLYHKCYETFLFIERFDSLGVTYKVDRNYQIFNEKERKALNYILLSQFLSLESEDSGKPYKSSSKVYKPKILTSIDDEKFVYDEILKGPIEFVRKDQAYIDYLKSKLDDTLPLHPNKFEKKYYEDEYRERNNAQGALREISKLISRVEKEVEHYEKEVQRLIALRNEEEALEAQRKLQELRARHQALLDEKRDAIIRAALEEKGEKVKPAKKKPVVETFEEKPQPIVEAKTVIKPVSEESVSTSNVSSTADDESYATPIFRKEVVVVKKSNSEREQIEVSEPVTKVEKTIVKTQPVAKEIPAEEEYVEAEPITKDENIEVPEYIHEEEEVIDFAPEAEETIEITEAIPDSEIEKQKEVKSEPKVENKEIEVKHLVKTTKIKNVTVVKKAPISKRVKESEVDKDGSAEIKVLSIPGRFIIKINEGYYVNESQISKAKSQAFVFDDFNNAKLVKARIGGKIIRL